ncbi:MAG: hypothetical protein E4H01_09665 [Lysobacterales bacterium]|nr:MAG: hypothetical protein E4H01_09665 [Xanthomonadales bacterium]
MNQKKRYLSYLLRLWQVSGSDLPNGDQQLWRASLETPQDGDRLAFASSDALFAFLENETGSSSSSLEHGDEESSQPPAIKE